MKKKNKYLLIGFGSIALTYILNKLIVFFSTVHNKLYSYNSHYYGWRFGKIFYTKQGKGKPILLVHDLNVRHSDAEWQKLIKELQKDYTVYTLDLLGCGRSDKPKLTYTTYLYVQLINDFIKEIIKEPTNIMASGLSSCFISMSCYQNPDYFEKLLYINPKSLTFLSKCPRRRHQINKVLLELPIIGDLLYNILHSKKRIKSSFKHSLYHNYRRVKRKYINFFHESAHINGETAKFLFASTNNFYTNTNIIHALKEINNSIYIIMGEEIKNASLILEEYKYYNSSIETSIIDESKGLPQLEVPKTVLEICRMYFN